MTSCRPQHSQVDTRPLIILNIRLATLRERSSPAKLVYNLLTPWFDGAARECLRYIDLPFNVREDYQAPLFRARVDKQLVKLGPYVAHLRLVLRTDDTSKAKERADRPVHIHPLSRRIRGPVLWRPLFLPECRHGTFSLAYSIVRAEPSY